MPLPSNQTIMKLLPESEEMIMKVHKLQQERYRRALARERKEAEKWSHLGIRKVRMPDGTHMKFRVPRLTYMMWQKKLGDECWDDAGFVHDYLKWNPQFRVTSKAVNPLSGWTPQSEYAKAYRRIRGQKSEVGDRKTEAAKGTILLPSGRPAPMTNDPKPMTPVAGGAQ